MPKPPRIKSTFALLDVTSGRKALAKHLDKHGPLDVVIHARIAIPWGGDDGTSIEFECEVQSVAPNTSEVER